MHFAGETGSRTVRVPISVVPSRITTMKWADGDLVEDEVWGFEDGEWVRIDGTIPESGEGSAVPHE